MFDYERLDVYQVSLQFVAWVDHRVDRLTGNRRHARDELIRASQSIPRNIAEGNGKRSRADRCRFFEIARGSGLESAAVLDELRVVGALEEDETREGKLLLHRIVSMLTKMTDPGDSVREERREYGEKESDYAHEHDEDRHEIDNKQIAFAGDGR